MTFLIPIYVQKFESVRKLFQMLKPSPFRRRPSPDAHYTCTCPLASRPKVHVSIGGLNVYIARSNLSARARQTSIGPPSLPLPCHFFEVSPPDDPAVPNVVFRRKCNSKQNTPVDIIPSKHSLGGFMASVTRLQLLSSSWESGAFRLSFHASMHEIQGRWIS